jgi:hypothetical protein
MTSYSKPRIRVVGLTSVLLRGGHLGAMVDFVNRFRIFS